MTDDARQQHLDLCKREALSFLEQGKPFTALSHFLIRMGERRDCGINTGLVGLALLYIRNGSEADLRRWFEGFR